MRRPRDEVRRAAQGGSAHVRSWEMVRPVLLPSQRWSRTSLGPNPFDFLRR